MKTQLKVNSRGKAYLIAALIGFAAGIVMYILTKVFVLALAIMLPMTLSIGIALEEKNNGADEKSSRTSRKYLQSLLKAGILVFVLFLLYFFIR